MQTNNLTITEGKNVRVRDNAGEHLAGKRGVVSRQAGPTLWEVKLDESGVAFDFSERELTALD